MKGKKCIVVKFDESKAVKFTEPNMKDLFGQVFFDHKTPADIFFGIGWFEPGGQCGWHTHKVPEAEYVLKGGPGEAQFEDRTEILKEGVAVYEPPGVPHNFVNTGKKQLYVLYTFPTSDPELMKNIPCKDPRKKR